MPAFSQMYELLRTIVRKQKVDRGQKGIRAYLFELNRSHELIKLVVSSISKCHELSVEAARSQNVPLEPNTLVDGRYVHSEVSSGGDTPKRARKNFYAQNYCLCINVKSQLFVERF